METNTKDGRIYSLLVLFDMHTKFFNRALNGISKEDSHQRLTTKANHVAWLAGSLVEQRYELAEKFGNKDQQAAVELFKNNKGIQEDITYPSLESYKADWEKITPTLRNLLASATSDQLDAIFEMMPGYKMTIFDFLSFVIYREASIIGQIALWRRLLGYDAMRYDD